MQSAEIELKFSVTDIADLERRAEAAGFELVTPRLFESNTLYDTADRQLRQRKELLRIRQYGLRWIMTHKRVPEKVDPESRFKTRVETETELSDGSALAEVFSRMGYGPVFRYEKYRTEWNAEDGHLVIDETPIGIWAELEGRPEWIEAMLSKLAVDSERCSTASYGSLFLAWKNTTGSAAENLTFDEVGVEVEAR